MNSKQTRLHILDKAKDLGGEAKTGVSLHCHTEHSKEMLDFVPHYAAKIPIVSYFWEKECLRYFGREGKEPDFSTGYWSPPLTGNEVYRLEKEQINGMNLEAVVSITDHDCIDANLQVGEQNNHAQAPISMEWTVPFEYAYLHVGVHNLPPERAVEITGQLLDYTFSKESPNNEKLREVFALLDEIPDVLIVLNHPLWDIEIVGQQRHDDLLEHFMREHGKWIHAFEINGFRSWSENKAVMELAKSRNMPIVTGGDRHCGKPNTAINLTNAKTFAEFAEEIRVDKRSEVVIMPEYREPLNSRQISSIAQILKHYPEFPEGRRRWFDRVHFDTGDGSGLQPLAAHWKGGGPKWLRRAVWLCGVLSHKSLRPAFRLAMKREDRVPKQITTGRRRSKVIGEPLIINVQ